MWNRHAELELLIPTASIFRNTHQFWKGRITQCPEYGNYMREILGARREWLDSELSKREYLAGDRFTVADITAVCALDFGKVVNERIDPATHPHLAAWHARVAARPSYKA
jgi:glutathione S-transferase